MSKKDEILEFRKWVSKELLKEIKWYHTDTLHKNYKVPEGDYVCITKKELVRYVRSKEQLSFILAKSFDSSQYSDLKWPYPLHKIYSQSMAWLSQIKGMPDE